MMKSIVRLLTVCVVLIAGSQYAGVQYAAAQGSVPRIPIQPRPVVRNNVIDSGYTAIPPADSIRMYDSIMALRKRQIEEASRFIVAHPIQDAFVTLTASVSAFNRVKAGDLNQYFAERSARPDPPSDRDGLSGLDRFITFGAQFHLTNDLAVGVEYDFMARYFNTVIENDSITHWPNGEEHLDITYHTLMTGPEVTLYRSRLLRVKMDGGIGAVIALATEEETATNAARSSSATGLAISFDLATDIHAVDWASFTIDLFARTIGTGKLKTSDGQDLSTGFGHHSAPFAIAPNANATAFGLAIGGIIYL